MHSSMRVMDGHYIRLTYKPKSWRCQRPLLFIPGLTITSLSFLWLSVAPTHLEPRINWFVLLSLRAQNSLEAAKLATDDLKCGHCHSPCLARSLSSGCWCPHFPRAGPQSRFPLPTHAGDRNGFPLPQLPWKEKVIKWFKPEQMSTSALALKGDLEACKMTSHVQWGKLGCLFFQVEVLPTFMEKPNSCVS